MLIKNTPQIGNPILRKKARPIKNFQDKNVQQAIKDLTDTMRDGGLIGLAFVKLADPSCSTFGNTSSEQPERISPKTNITVNKQSNFFI